MNKFVRWLLIGDGAFILYTFFYAYIVHFNIMIKGSTGYFHIPFIYPVTIMGILGIILIYSGITGKINMVGRILAGITSVLSILFIYLQGVPMILAHGLLVPVVIAGFPFAGGLLFFHIIFQHTLGGGLGFILAVKPSLLLKVKKALGVGNKKE